ncbi:hypothetical protein FNF31_06969 [Cafeteria roenbergensis]|uniref:BAR domain-containing protein n=1 Tax=Cafeteria roenbergensis TaxID=33653 RepID=A0A5A8CEZ9_CAFRO|nr:hypothetical protein FNF31_06969 [Cafeteria roenbergensis]
MASGTRPGQQPISDVMLHRIQLEKNVAVKLLAEVKSDVNIDKAAASRRATTADSLRELAEVEPDSRFRKVFESLADALGQVERTRKGVLCDRFSETLIEPLNTLISEHFAPAERLLADRVSLLKRAETAQAAAAKATGSAVAVQSKRMAAMDATQQAINADAMAQSAIVRSAHQRAADLKEILSEYVRGRMLFHCRALEGFSRASAVIAGADPSRAAAEVERAMLDAATDSAVLALPGDEKDGKREAGHRARSSGRGGSAGRSGAGAGAAAAAAAAGPSPSYSESEDDALDDDGPPSGAP